VLASALTGLLVLRAIATLTPLAGRGLPQPPASGIHRGAFDEIAHLDSTGVYRETRWSVRGRMHLRCEASGWPGGHVDGGGR